MSSKHLGRRRNVSGLKHLGPQVGRGQGDGPRLPQAPRCLWRWWRSFTNESITSLKKGKGSPMEACLASRAIGLLTITVGNGSIAIEIMEQSLPHLEKVISSESEALKISARYFFQQLISGVSYCHSMIVFHPEPSNYKNMHSACSDFGKLVSHCMELVEELRSSVDTPALIAKANNWQASSSSFIESLSKEYAGYKDLIQPVQVAIYEMKLGLSLAVFTTVERDYLRKVDEENSERILAIIYSLVQFPRESHPGFIPDYLKPTVIHGILHTSKSTQVIDINFLKKLATISSDISSDKAL